MSIFNDPEVERVGDYREAYCSECGSHYGAHRDGDCPHCGTELEFSPNYAALMVAGFEGVARRLGEDHARPDVCEACVENTPLAVEWASDVPKAAAFNDAVSDAEDAVERLGTDPHWVRRELAEAYEAGFRDASGDPTDCMVCRDAAADDDLECGHDESGEPCPAR